MPASIIIMSLIHVFFAPKGSIGGPCFGAFCAAAAVMMSWQAYDNFRDGCMVLSFGDASRDKHPILFFLAFVFNILGIVFLIGASIFGFMT